MKNILLFTISHNLMGGRWIPAAAGALISYCLRDSYIKENYNFLPPEFRPECISLPEFHETLKTVDIIGLTCYVWNQDLNDKISILFKEINPNGIVIYGGPNVPQSFNEAMEFANQKLFVDKFFVGPGEKTFLNFLKNQDAEGTYDNTQFNITQDRQTYQITKDDTPTPFQQGIFDHILSKEKSIGIAFETTRGCPYSCAFCDWGSQANSKVIKFNDELLKKEIDYFLKFNEVHWIDFTDANYGIFDRDVDIIQHIVDNKNQVKSVSFSGFAKNGSPRSIEILNLIHSNFEMQLHEFKISFQTLSDNTLKAINRSNIPTKKLIKLMDESKDKVVSAELIIGLPGETADSWLDTLCKTIDLNISFLKIHRLLVLTNTPMNSEEYIKEHNLVFQKVRVARSIINNGTIVEVIRKHGNIDNLHVTNDSSFEEFKIIRNCNSFDDDELIRMHKYNFWFNALISGHFLKNEIKNHHMTTADQCYMFFDNLKNMPFFSSILDYYISTLDKVIVNKYDNISTINSYKDYFCFMMNRSTENLQIYDNLETAISEIKQMYPNASFNHIIKKNALGRLRLAQIYANLSK